MTLTLEPEVAAALEALANARGLSIEEYLEQLVKRETPVNSERSADAQESGMAFLFTAPAGPCLPARSK